jgi:gliding motility-associated-like protein
VKYWLLFFFVFYCFYSSCQTIFYQDICKCGVTGAGFSSALGAGSGSFQVYIEPGSTIKKAYLFAVQFGDANDTVITINSTPFSLSDSTKISSFDELGTFYAKNISIHAVEVTNTINPSVTNYNVTIPFQNSCIACSYNCIYLYIVYENPSFTQSVSANALINNKDGQFEVNYSAKGLNPKSVASPLSFALYSDRIGTAAQLDQSILYFSTVPVSWVNVGTIGGSDNVNNLWIGGGVKGHFYYQNNTLFGLDDDTPDNIVGGSDGLMDASSYFFGDSLKWKLNWTHPSTEGIYNIYNGFFLTYTTPCDTFTTHLLTEDTTVCRGETMQLGVSGGNTSLSKPAYEWLPQKDLSCYNCANPVFTGDSSQVYTVRVWNTDSCSKVLPVRVKVLPQPQFTSMVTTFTTCGVSTGSLTAVSTSSTDSLFSNNVYVGKIPQTLTNLGAGNYTLYLIDTNSCKSKDTSVTINSVNLTNALFTLNPSTGAVPLSVSSENQSTHATDYMWYFQNDSTTITSPSFEFDTSGTYTITLIAYNNIPNCSDTFSLQIIVYDSLQLIIPNVFTPNGDTQNDVFSIQVNAPCTGTITLTNRWGNELFSKNISTDGKQKISLWNGASQGKPVSDGTYFYLLKLQDKQGKGYSFQGFVELVR